MTVIVEVLFHGLYLPRWRSKDKSLSEWSKKKKDWNWFLVVFCSFNDICIIRGHFPVPSSFTSVKKSEGECFPEPVIVYALNHRHCFFPSLSFTHVAAFSFRGSQTTDKASVKWDLAGTWTELAGVVGDIIWKWRPALSTDRRGCQRQQGEEVGTGAVLWSTFHVSVKEMERACQVHPPRCVWFLFSCTSLSIWDKPDWCCCSCLARL